MFPSTLLVCVLSIAPTAAPPPRELAKLIERVSEQRRMYPPDDMFADHQLVVIGRLEAKLEWAKKNCQPQAEIDDIQQALAAWRESGPFHSTDPVESLKPEPKRPQPAKPKVDQPAPTDNAEAIAALLLVIVRMKERGESQSTVDYYQKLLDELRKKPNR